jgi:hypothetical protein
MQGLKAVPRALFSRYSPNLILAKMKKISNILILAVILFSSTALFAQDRTYTEGSVWSVGFIKVNANMNVEYLNNMKNTWKAMQDEAVKQGLIVSYKILQGSAANPDDWDIMLMREFKNLAAMEGKEDAWAAISKKVIGGEDATKKLNESRVSMRTIYGNKIVREVVYK